MVARHTTIIQVIILPRVLGFTSTPYSVALELLYESSYMIRLTVVVDIIVQL